MWQNVKNFYHLLTSYLAALYFGFPSKKLIVIGVTGTDGKTTTVNMIYHILKVAGEKVSMVSSVNAQIGTKTQDTGFHVTTPSPWQVQRLLTKAVNSSSKYFVFEVTSHGLDQDRVANVNFKVAVATNITHEHLDYHKTWEKYAEAKAKLFANANYAILNMDDKSYDFLKNRSRGKTITYSLYKDADFNLKNYPVKVPIIGDYNCYNALAASAATKALGVSKSKILKALRNMPSIIGRMEEIDLEQDFTVIVDFAHTPNALFQALQTLKFRLQNPKSKLIAVFGSAGKRDKLKRPLMGESAANLAHFSILTAEDPRNEKVKDICSQIAVGFSKFGKKEGKDYLIVEDRQKAIEDAVNLAKQGDIVAIFGKSHEKSMCYGKREYPWNEFGVVKEAIKKRSQK